MTDKDVIISTRDDCGTPVIDAPPMTVVRNNNKIKFDNQLDSTGSDPDDGAEVSIQFYGATDAGNVSISAEDFCSGYSGGTALTIAAKSKYNCDVIPTGAFKYDVAAFGYVTLDPVIIVEAPPIARDLPDVWLIIGAVALASATYYIGFRRGSARD